jgi:putative ABC transport system substrate-binding protein
MYFSRDFASDGGLISYGPNLSEAYHQVGVYAGQILNGAKPANMPVVQPSKFELVINLKTARELGLTISREFLLVADDVLYEDAVCRSAWHKCEVPVCPLL